MMAVRNKAHARVSIRVSLVVFGLTAAAGVLTVPAASVAGTDCSGRLTPAQQKRCAHPASAVAPSNKLRFVSPNPQTTPPLHGTEPHGQGTVAVLQVNPDSARPYSSDPAGGKSPNQELIVVGRSRGEQRANGTYHGHITIAAVGGNEILGVDTNPGETKGGPLDAVQQQVLNPLCDGTMRQVCLSAVVANSSTTSTGSTNHFEAAKVTLGGATGIDAGAASSDGNISSNGTCQTATGASQVANVNAGGTVLASLVKSSTTSTACQDPSQNKQTDTSSVIGLGGTGVPIPAPGCADGTANTVTGIPTAAPVVCNADDSLPGTNPANGAGGQQTTTPYGVREALDVFLLATTVPPGSASKATTAASESHAVAPPGAAQCPAGQTGTPPNCVPNSGQCPAGQTGTPPNCVPNSGRCPAGQTGTPPNCVPNSGRCPAGQTGTPPNCVPSGNVCFANGDNDCVNPNAQPGATGPSISESGATDKGRDCAAGVSDGGLKCPSANKASENNSQGVCNTGGDNDCVNPNAAPGTVGPRISENGSIDIARDCAEGIHDGPRGTCPAGAAGAHTRASLPFTGEDLIPFGIGGLALLGGGLALRRRTGRGSLSS